MIRLSKEGIECSGAFRNIVLQTRDQLMFNKIKFAVAGTVIAAAMAATGASAATVTADATVNVLGPIAITVDNSLNFGTVAPGASGGTVVVGTASNVATCTGVLCLPGSAKRGQFHISSAMNGAVINISVGNAIDLTGAGTAIPLTGLTMSDADGKITYSSTLAENVYVGGTITVNNGQAAGVYTGSFDITADYQ
jgi:Mat/Ecp fimbriae major subunit